MTNSSALLKLIHDTKAVSIWNRKTGPVFWYAAGVPGPFYVNTELVVGPELAKKLLDQITSIVAGSNDPATRVAQLNKAILGAYENSPAYKQVIAAMIAKAKEEFPSGSYAAISGGERRDWLFSIPFAKETGTRHLFLFKNGTYYSEEPIMPGEKTLHIADLINNAASYFDLWLPILQKAQLPCAGTLCVNSRGSNGVDRLKANGNKVVALNSIDASFFEQWQKEGLTDQATLEELKIFFASAKEWGRKYLTADVGIFDVAGLDGKSFERLQGFFAQDPWGLRQGHESFFEAMKQAINARRAAAA
jgi:orotate phosphoribosyltransferase